MNPAAHLAWPETGASGVNVNSAQVAAAVACGVLPGILLGWWLHGRRQRQRVRTWPDSWPLRPRPLFTAHERALYRELKAALPQHVVLAKVSLVRFCQAAEPRTARQWYDRLQALTVSMLVCTPTGTAIAAIDLDLPGSMPSPRTARLKQAVLDVCRVRHLRCQPGQWPPPPLLAAWVLGHGVEGQPMRATDPLEPGALSHAGDQLARRLKERRAERAVRWAESGFAPDSFFAFDSRLDAAANSAPAPLTEMPPAAPASDARPRPGQARG